MGDVALCNMVQVSHPSIRPLMDQLGLPVGLAILPSVPDQRKFSFAASFAFVVMFLPQIRTMFVSPCINRRRAEAWRFQDFKSSFDSSYHI